jgi:hypothetical protein
MKNMKIYVNDKINSIKVTSFLKSKKMEQYLIDKTNVINIYSREGIFQVIENNTYKTFIQSEEIENKIINNVNCLIYKSLLDKKKVHQIPFDHIIIPSIIFKYSLSNNSQCNLIIECIQNQMTEKPDELKPINYYFEINKEVDYDILNFMQDSNVFLSMLN